MSRKANNSAILPSRRGWPGLRFPQGNAGPGPRGGVWLVTPSRPPGKSSMGVEHSPSVLLAVHTQADGSPGVEYTVPHQPLRQPVDADRAFPFSIQGRSGYYVEPQDNGPDWQLRMAFIVLLPKGKQRPGRFCEAIFFEKLVRAPARQGTLHRRRTRASSEGAMRCCGKRFSCSAPSWS